MNKTKAGMQNMQSCFDDLNVGILNQEKYLMTDNYMYRSLSKYLISNTPKNFDHAMKFPF